MDQDVLTSIEAELQLTETADESRFYRFLLVKLLFQNVTILDMDVQVHLHLYVICLTMYMYVIVYENTIRRIQDNSATGTDKRRLRDKTTKAVYRQRRKNKIKRL